MNKTSDKVDKQVVEGKVFAILSYLSILCIVPLIFKRDNNFVLSHGKQGLVIFLGQVALFVVHIIPFLEWTLQFGIFILGVISFLGIISVLKGQYIKIPIISDIAENITL